MSAEGKPSFSCPKGYKQTEVGVIPEDWNVVSFGTLINYIKGYAFKSSEFVADGVRIIRVSDMTYGSIEDNEAIFLSESSVSSFSKWRLRENDLVFSTVGSKPPMYDSLVGKTILVPCKYSGSLLNQNAVLIRAKIFSAGFQKLLLNHFQTNRYIHYIEAIFRGNANQASITLVDLFNYRLPLPPTKAEQEAIAEALSDADALIESLEELLVKKRQIKQGAMQELLTGKKRLPGFEVKPGYKQTEVGFIPEDWVFIRLGDVVRKFINGGTPSTKNDAYWVGDIPWITGADILSQKVDEIRRFINNDALINSSTNIVGKGNLLIVTRTGVGKLAIAPFDIAISQDFTGIYTKEERLSAEYLYRFLGLYQSLLACQNQGTSILGITRETLSDITIFIPPTLNEQEAIITIFSDMDAGIAELEAKLAKARQIKQGMMQELLTGRIRLVESEKLGVESGE